MARRPSEGTCGGSHDRNCFGDHWLIRIALLPAALTLAAIGITEVIAFGTGISWTLPDPAGMKPARGADDYVEGLARLGIAKLPGYESLPVTDAGPRGGSGPLTHFARARA